MLGLLLKIPYVKQIAIGLVIALIGHSWYIMSKNDALLTRNGQLQSAVDGWESSYNSLEFELAQYDSLLTEKRNFETELENKQTVIENLIAQAEEENKDVELWFKQKHPIAIIDLRNKLRLQNGTATTKDSQSKTAK